MLSHALARAPGCNGTACAIPGAFALDFKFPVGHTSSAHPDLEGKVIRANVCLVPSGDDPALTTSDREGR
jgi:hypothetical protein